jgi:hypothetical protein
MADTVSEWVDLHRRQSRTCPDLSNLLDSAGPAASKYLQHVMQLQEQ